MLFTCLWLGKVKKMKMKIKQIWRKCERKFFNQGKEAKSRKERERKGTKIIIICKLISVDKVIFSFAKKLSSRAYGNGTVVRWWGVEGWRDKGNVAEEIQFLVISLLFHHLNVKDINYQIYNSIIFALHVF